LKQFFTNNKQREKQPAVAKLSREFEEISQRKKKEYDAKIVQIQKAASKPSTPVVDQSSSNGKKQMRRAAVDPDSDDDEQLQQQQQMSRHVARVTQSQMSTIDVEHAIAKETMQEAMQIKEEFDELHTMMNEFKNIVVEQDPLVDQIANNVEDSENNVWRGTNDVREAKRINKTFGFV